MDKELLKAEVRPSVEEQIRLQSDEEMRMLLGNIKVGTRRLSVNLGIFTLPVVLGIMAI